MAAAKPILAGHIATLGFLPSMRYRLLVMFLLALYSNLSSANELKVAVASNFYHSLKLLVAQSHVYRDQIKLSSGASGLLFAQIKNGAPFDVFLSADKARPQRLKQQGLASLVRTYAYGQLVLWPSQGNAFDTLSTHQGRLAIANPQLAPYGAAAQDVLHQLKLVERYQGRIITGNNVNQAFQFVDSGNAPLGIFSKAQLIQAQLALGGSEADKYRHFAPISPQHYQPIAQQAAVLTKAKNKQQAMAFLTWLLSKTTQKRIVALGYLAGLQE